MSPAARNGSTPALSLSRNHLFQVASNKSLFKDPVLPIEGVVAQWCNLMSLKEEQSGGVGSIPSGTPPLERHEKGRGLD